MQDPVRDHCEELATELMQLSEAERVRRILALCDDAVTESEAVPLIVLGLVLRDRNHHDWAEYVFRIALRIPNARHMAMFELSTVLAYTERPEEAIRQLRDLENEKPLGSYQQQVFAHQLGRTGDWAEGSRRLDEAYALEPEAERECVAIRQFYDFCRAFPDTEMLSRCEQLRKSYRFRFPEDVLSDIRSALAGGTPYSLIRLNDGEGSIIRLSIDDEAKYRELYTRNRREFHRWWFGNEQTMFTSEFDRAVFDMNESISRADCVAAFIHEHLRLCYHRADIRNIPGFTNIIRKLEQIRDTDPAAVPRIALADPYIHQFLLFRGDLERLLSEQPRIGLVSCHDALPDALKRKFGFDEVFFHRTPGESTITKGVEPEPFSVWHPRLKHELAQAQAGVLYLVAAGIMSKIYCDLIKSAGGIALDVGSVVDIWMKVPTRVFWDVAKQHGLEAT